MCGLLCVAVQISAVAATETSKKETSQKQATPPSSTRAASSTHHRTSASAHSSVRKGKHARGKAKSRSARKRGQQAIDSGRARQIQEALIREHYLEGAPSGTWDSATQAAMQRYQADQGWQTKTIPDSRALIKLGLGPSPEHLLNPDSAMTTAPLPASARGESKPTAADPPTSSSSKTESDNPPQR